jgi:hypothetical protein
MSRDYYRVCECCGRELDECRVVGLDPLSATPRYILPPAQRHSHTSVAAAKKIAPKASTLRDKVYAAIAGSHGLTDEECQLELHLDPSTQRPRRIELVRAGLVRDSGQRRYTLSNRLAVVWVAT